MGSIWNSVIAVLQRDPFGQDPCVPFEVIKDGFITVRQNRREFMDASRRENVNYSLYQTDDQGDFTLVAENRDNHFTYNKELFEDCFKVPAH